MIRSLPDAGGSWRRVVHESTQSSLAHAPEWFQLIQEAYGHHPIYLSAHDGQGRWGVLPAFAVRRPFFGTVVTSMPFLDSGGPCAPSLALARVLVDHLVAEARRIGARLVELRCSEPLSLPVAPIQTKVNMTLHLQNDPDHVWRHFDKTVRNQVRKAERSGLTIELGGAEKLSAFYDAFVERMRDLGSPVHAPAFLAAVFERFGSQARILLVKKGNQTAGGLVALTFKDRLIVPWATSSKEYFPLCPNMLLYWEAIRMACVEGFRRFDFGRSSRDSGTYRFKAQWGAREEPLFWYTIPIATTSTTVNCGTDESRTRSLLVSSWRHLPLCVTRQLGPRIRRYLIQ